MDKGISILELRDTPNDNLDLLNSFITLYNETFTDTSEREDPNQWAIRMWLVPAELKHITHLLIAYTTDDSTGDRCLVGGLVFEHYLKSQCGLLTYLVIEKKWRQRGIARVLVDKALSILMQEEHNLGKQLKAAFCEVEDPQLVSDENSTMPTCERLQAIMSLGARVLNFKYIQPPLVGGSGHCNHLLLLAFDLQNFTKNTVNKPHGISMEGSVIREFLYEFYQVEKITKPDDYEILSNMAEHLNGEIIFYDPLRKSNRGYEGGPH